MSDVALAEVLTENSNGATLRPQTTCRPIGVVLGIQHRTPWARAGQPGSPCRTWNYPNASL